MDDLQVPDVVTTALGRTSQNLTVEFVPRNLKMINISTSELDAVASLSPSVHMGFLGMSLGGLVAFGIVLGTVEIMNPSMYATFVALTAVSAVFTLYFGVRAGLDSYAARKKLRELKEGAV